MTKKLSNDQEVLFFYITLTKLNNNCILFLESFFIDKKTYGCHYQKFLMQKFILTLTTKNINTDNNNKRQNLLMFTDLILIIINLFEK